MTNKNLTLTALIALSTALFATSGNTATFQCPAKTDFTQPDKTNSHFYTATKDGVTYHAGYIPTQGAEEVQIYDNQFSHYMDCYYSFDKKSGFKARSTDQEMFGIGKKCTVKNATFIKDVGAYKAYKCTTPGSCEVECQ